MISAVAAALGAACARVTETRLQNLGRPGLAEGADFG